MIIVEALIAIGFIWVLWKVGKLCFKLGKLSNKEMK
jgi:ABC-type glucose/galactose transport system permease subunit